MRLWVVQLPQRGDRLPAELARIEAHIHDEPSPHPSDCSHRRVWPELL
jgi:hypothetical protein